MTSEMRKSKGLSGDNIFYLRYHENGQVLFNFR